ncbi:MAG: hypothetical protein H6686_08130 [Fibrobacteria bacterium]|nr:hypothetical protein [Fibrobacteria bacterium]
MRILVSNDDGLDSPALHALVESLVRNHDVTVAVPSRQCSGTGHGFTFTRPIEVRETELHGATVLVVDGFPADAVKYAICTREKPDVVLAGINPGENAGVCAPYSGTVACAREAALWGLPAFALSTLGMQDGHYRAIARWVTHLLLDPPPTPLGTFWNINFPSHAPASWGTPRLCAGASAMFRDEYKPAADGFWQLEGFKPPEAIAPDSDDDWLRRGHPTMVPHRVDATDHDLLNRVAWKPPTAFVQDAP